ncbi:MAG: ATP-binding protein [Bacteroidales bacterium]|nr:ATP-binding protein [Bacteroidales bacterium]
MTTALKNPFVVIGDIPTEYFCDRVAETRQLVKTITNEGNVVLISPRRMGKSRLVKHCYKQSEIEGQYYLFYIDLLHTSSLRELTYTFGLEVFNTMKSQSQKAALSLVQALKSLAGTFGFDALSGMPTFTVEVGRLSAPDFTLSEIFSWLEQADKPCLICFDEFQQVSNYPENKNGEIEAMLRGHIQHMRNANFIFSGSERHLLLEMFASKARPFYNSANIMTLDPIAPDVYCDFAQHWFKAYKKDLDTQELHRYYEVLEGSTYYLQKLMHEAFINCEPGETCGKDLLEHTLNEMIEESNESFRKQLGSLTERQKEVLSAIAREGRAQKVLSTAFIKKHALASTSVVQSALKRMMEFGLITQTAGSYSLTDPLHRLIMLYSVGLKDY